MNTQNKDNWKDYEVLATGPFSKDNIDIKMSDDVMKTNDVSLKVIDQMWSQMVKGRASVGLETWDNTVFRFNGYSLKDGNLEIDIGETTFKNLQGTNATNWILGDIFGYDYLANGMLVKALVKVKDGDLILGRRNTGAKKEFEPYAIFGGTMDKHDSTGVVITDGSNPFTAMNIELNEELGIDESHIERMNIQWLVRDYKYYSIFVFEVELNIGFDELNALFNESGDEEHSKIIHAHRSFLESLIADSPERVKDGTLMALDLYLGK